jgi:hypothetical protein
LSSPAIELGQARLGAEPHHTVRALGDGMHTIRRQAMKKCDSAPLMQTCYRSWRR